MYIIDLHCDSIGVAPPLVKNYNFSQNHPQLQVVALYDTTGENTLSYINTFKECAKNENLCIVKEYGDIKLNRHCAILSIEGGTVLETHSLKSLYDEGVRILGLAWLSNALAKSNRLSDGEIDTGISDFGKKIINEGNDLGVIFDVSHLSDNSFWDMAELSKKPIIATHSNFRAVCPHSRNLTDDMAREIIRQGGVIGLNLYPVFVGENATADTLFEHIDHCMSLGGKDCLGFGFDIDGTDGMYISPVCEKESIHDKVIDLMLRHGYSDELVKKIACKNLLEYLKKYL